MTKQLRRNATPPARVKQDGRIEDPRGPVGFSAALAPFLSARGEKELEEAQLARMRMAFNEKTGLYGNPARYYDQNLTLFALGTAERQFWFDAQGALKTRWHD